jgi:uncharacterized protein (TIGR03435 family)
MRRLTHTGVFALFSCALVAQSPANALRFEFAAIHSSAKTRNGIFRAALVHNGRYEVKQATMLDLIRTAWNFDADRVLGGPNWLELDKFDITAKAPADSTVETQRLMLQSLLKDRFRLVLHEGTGPVPAWALTADKKNSLKEADGSGETGCKSKIEVDDPQASPATRGPLPLMVHYSCRNTTMADFGAGLRSMTGVQLRVPVIDQTGVQGKWNFEVTWSALVRSDAANRQSSPAEALEKQVGLKLEQVPVSKPVLVVESVARMPSPDPPGTKEALPDIAIPREFEVADVKLVDPGAPRPARRGFGMQPGGRFVAEGVTMLAVLGRAFNTADSDPIADVPSWAASVQLAITAKVPPEYPAGQTIDNDIIGSMLRALLKERFGLAWHTEQRMVSSYSLVAAKPKLKQASRDSSIYCKNAPPSPFMVLSEQALACQNATMVLLAEQLRDVPAISAPVEDATGLEGGWDFTFSYNALRPAAPGPADIGSEYTIFESIEKQLGLKLKAEKKTSPVTVIDRLNQKPTDN